MSTDLVQALHPDQRRFFELLLDSTSPAWMDVAETSRMVFGNPDAGQVLMSTPAGREWRELHLRRNRDGVAEILERIATGDYPRSVRRTAYEYDEDGQMRPKAAIVTTRQPTHMESMRAMRLLKDFGMATDNIAERMAPKRSREELLE